MSESNGYERPKRSTRPMDKRIRDTPGLPPADQVAPHGGSALGWTGGRGRDDR